MSGIQGFNNTAPPENAVERVGMLGRPGGLRTDQLDTEGVREPARDLLLQSEKIARVAVEPLRPRMRIGRGIAMGDGIWSSLDLSEAVFLV
jgi:hypothetical protein